MTASSPADPGGERVFLSYSTTPPENREFVRELARWLHEAGFQVWLDEEQLPAGVDFTHRINVAIGLCSHSLLIVTREWLAKAWTVYEGELLARRGKQILMIEREKINHDDLGPHLYKIQHIEWLAGDPEPDARLWQVYCGLKGIAPGERRQWASKGRELGHGRSAAVAVPPPAPSTAPDGSRLQVIAAAPVLVPSGASHTYVLLDDCRWLAVAPGTAELEHVPEPDGPVSDAVVDDADLVVSLYQPLIARLTRGSWDYRPVESCALKLLSTETGLVLGHLDGSVCLAERTHDQTIAKLDEPIIDLQEFDSGVVMLGGAGSLARACWPDLRPAATARLDTAELGPPVELFATGSLSRVGVIGPRRVGLLHATADWNLQVSPPLPDEIESAAGLGQRGMLGVLTESGAMWIVDMARGGLHRVNMPGSTTTVQSLVRVSQNHVFAVTGQGELFQVHADGTVRSLAVKHVLGAFAPAAHPGQVLVLRQEGDLLQAQWIEAGVVRSHSP